MLAKQSNYNIVTGPNVENQEKLTIHLDDVPISQAINLIIRASGLSYEIIGNSILVANKSKLNSDVGVKPHVIHLEYANAQQVSDLLINITESITIDYSGNNLLVSASPKKINEIENIHSEDVANALWLFYKTKNNNGVYNIGGGRSNSCSILEVIDFLKNQYDIITKYQILKENRSGDHIWYISDNSKFKKLHKNWKIKKTLKDIVSEIVEN